VILTSISWRTLNSYVVQPPTDHHDAAFGYEKFLTESRLFVPKTSADVRQFQSSMSVGCIFRNTSKASVHACFAEYGILSRTLLKKSFARGRHIFRFR
jgi:hypothetical protein